MIKSPKFSLVVPVYNEICQTLRKTEDVAEYLSRFYGLLQYIDDDVIIAQTHLNAIQKCHILCKKNNVLPTLKAVDGVVELYAGDTYVCDYSSFALTLEFFHVTQDSIIIEGKRSILNFNNNLEQLLFLSLGGKKFLATNVDNTIQDEYLLDEKTLRSFVHFKVTVPLQEVCVGDLRFVANILGQDVELNNITTEKFFPAGEGATGSYFVFDHFMMKQVKNVFWIRRKSFVRHLVWETKFLYRIMKGHKYGWEKALSVVALRCFYHIAKPMCKNQIWLLLDRINKADDNAEALFKYMAQINSPVRRYFVLGKNAEGTEKLSKFGKIIAHRSLRHFALCMLADKFVSSADPRYAAYPSQALAIYWCDIAWHQKIIFLQHGVIENDLSGWLNRYNKNLSLFITTTFAEYNSIVHTYSYFYSDDVVRLVGLARYDYLADRREKIIILAPTWRKYAVINNRKVVNTTGARPYNPDFKESEYFKFYDSLMHDERLNAVAEEYGYKIFFFPNPTIVSNLCDFHGSETVEILDFNTPYREVFARGALLVTDFSSVAFDFAYLKKPVIYTQFDKGRFFKEHWSPGYFDYEKDGFGEVAYDLDHAVELIIDYIKHDCPLKEEYKKRIENTFAFWDKNNCKRNYEAILAL